MPNQGEKSSKIAHKFKNFNNNMEKTFKKINRTYIGIQNLYHLNNHKFVRSV